MNRGAAAWLVLAAALAVPGFLFYRWWSHLDTESKKQLNMKVRKRLPADEALFRGAPQADRLTNPMAQQTAVSTATLAAATTETLSAAMDPVTGYVAAPGDAAAPGLSSVEAAASTGVFTATPEQALVPLAVITRDPTLSPYDVARLEQMAQEKALREQELRDELARSKAPKVRYEPDPRTKVDLQGIVSTDEGEKAIVNGEVVAAGDVVSGVKVVQITPKAVVFSYKGKRFSKMISK